MPIGVINRTAPTAADILCGIATANGGTIIVIPAGRTWHGVVTISASVRVASGGAAVDAIVTVSTAGAGVTPPAGVYLRLQLCAPASIATGNGTSDSGQVSAPMTIIAPAGNAVSLVLNSANTNGQLNATANGQLL